MGFNSGYVVGVAECSEAHAQFSVIAELHIQPHEYVSHCVLVIRWRAHVFVLETPNWLK